MQYRSIVSLLTALLLAGLTLTSPVNTGNASVTSNGFFVDCPAGSIESTQWIFRNGGSGEKVFVAACCATDSPSTRLCELIGDPSQGEDAPNGPLLCSPDGRAGQTHQEAYKQVVDPHRSCKNGGQVWEEHPRGCLVLDNLDRRSESDWIDCPRGSSESTQWILQDGTSGDSINIAACCADTLPLRMQLNGAIGKPDQGEDATNGPLLCSPEGHPESYQQVVDPHRSCKNGASVWENHPRGCIIPDSNRLRRRVEEQWVVCPGEFVEPHQWIQPDKTNDKKLHVAACCVPYVYPLPASQLCDFIGDLYTGENAANGPLLCSQDGKGGHDKYGYTQAADHHGSCVNGATVWKEHPRGCLIPPGHQD